MAEWKLDGILPIYIKDESFPRKTDAEEILTKVENIVGKKARRCLRYGKTWMVYVKDNEARTKIMRVGLTVEGKLIPAFDSNPYVALDEDGNVIKTTKLVVSHIPPTFDSDEIVAFLVEKGIAFHSEFMKEKMYLKDGTIHPRWETGNLFAYIAVPKKPLPNFVSIGKYKIKLKHREQIQEVVCRKCFQKGHYARYCNNEVVCIECKQPGHKRGDAACRAFEQYMDRRPKDDGEETESDTSDDEKDLGDEEDNDHDDGVSNHDDEKENTEHDTEKNIEKNKNMDNDAGSGEKRDDDQTYLKGVHEMSGSTLKDSSESSKAAVQNENDSQNKKDDNKEQTNEIKNKEQLEKKVSEKRNENKEEIKNKKLTGKSSLIQTIKKGIRNPTNQKEEKKIAENGQRLSRSDSRGTITTFLENQQSRRSSSAKRRQSSGQTEPPSKKPNA